MRQLTNMEVPVLLYPPPMEVGDKALITVATFALNSSSFI